MSTPAPAGLSRPSRAYRSSFALPLSIVLATLSARPACGEATPLLAGMANDKPAAAPAIPGMPTPAARHDSLATPPAPGAPALAALPAAPAGLAGEPRLRPDRLQHLSLALGIGVAVGIPSNAPAAGAGAALAASLAKELADDRFDRSDLVAGALGAALAWLVVRSLSR